MNGTTELRLKKGITDEWYTPEGAVLSIIRMIDKNKKIWLPFDKSESNFVKILSQNGYNIIYSHIEDGKDFFNYEPESWDIIISNPPYSLRNDILDRCFSFEKPFALLMNTNGMFDSKIRWDMFQNNNFTLFYLKGRVNYMREYGVTDKSSPPFQSAYVCSGMFNQRIIFEGEEWQK